MAAENEQAISEPRLEDFEGEEESFDDVQELTEDEWYTDSRRELDAPSSEQGESSGEAARVEGSQTDETGQAASIPPQGVAPVQPVQQPSYQQVQQPQAPAPSMEEMRSKLIDDIQKRFQFDDRQREALIDNPNEVLPKMLAEAYVGAYDEAMQSVYQNVPSLVEQQIATAVAAEKYERMFYDRWPGLAQRRETEAYVRQIGPAWRQANPGGSPTDFIEQVGNQISRMLGVESGAKRPAPPPAPAGAGRVAPTRNDTGAQRRSIFDLMAQDYDQGRW